MLSKKNALVLLWTGNDLPDYLVEKIADILTTNGITMPELLKVVYKDEEGLATALIQEHNGVTTVKFNVKDDQSPLEEALTYICKRFEVSLHDTTNGLITFALKLQTELNDAGVTISCNPLNASDDDKALTNAVEIIATSSITPTLLRKHHISSNVIKIIKQIYNLFT